MPGTCSAARRAALAPRVGPQSGEFSADACHTRGDRALVTNQPARVPDQDRRSAGPSWALCHLPDGRGRRPAARFCRHPEHDQRPARAAAIRGARMTDASPITLNTGDGIVVSNQPKNSARSGQNRQMTRPSDATQSVAWKLKRLRSGKLHSAGLAFTAEKPNGNSVDNLEPVLKNAIAAAKENGPGE